MRTAKATALAAFILATSIATEGRTSTGECVWYYRLAPSHYCTYPTVHMVSYSHQSHLPKHKHCWQLRSVKGYFIVPGTNETRTVYARMRIPTASPDDSFLKELALTKISEKYPLLKQKLQNNEWIPVWYQLQFFNSCHQYWDSPTVWLPGQKFLEYGKPKFEELSKPGAYDDNWKPAVPGEDSPLTPMSLDTVSVSIPRSTRFERRTYSSLLEIRQAGMTGTRNKIAKTSNQDSDVLLLANFVPVSTTSTFDEVTNESHAWTNEEAFNVLPVRHGLLDFPEVGKRIGADSLMRVPIRQILLSVICNLPTNIGPVPFGLSSRIASAESDRSDVCNLSEKANSLALPGLIEPPLSAPSVSTALLSDQVSAPHVAGTTPAIDGGLSRSDNSVSPNQHLVALLALASLLAVTFVAWSSLSFCAFSIERFLVRVLSLHEFDDMEELLRPIC